MFRMLILECSPQHQQNPIMVNNPFESRFGRSDARSPPRPPADCPASACIWV